MSRADSETGQQRQFPKTENRGKSNNELGRLEGPDFCRGRRPDCGKTVAKRGGETLDFIGASEGIRTLDIHLGKVTLYQTELRSLPNKPGKIKPTRLNCKPRFSAMNPAYSKS